MSYTNKTQPTEISPENYLKKHFKGKEKVQNEALALIDVYTRASGSPCVMWNKIFGFGMYNYKDSKGGEHTHLATGFAISSTGFTLYDMMGWEMRKKELQKLGKHKISGKSCLAIKSVVEIDGKVLKMIIKQSLVDMRKRYKTHT